MKKCKIKSIKSIGTKKTYSLTMQSDQHNYFLYDKNVDVMVPTMNSHSAAYSMLAYQTAYLKVKFPFEYMCSLLTSEINNGDKNLKLNSYIAEATRMGIVVKKTDINRSRDRFAIEVGKNKRGEAVEFIRAPLTVLKGVGSKAVDEIILNQPFNDLKDFIKKVDGRKVNKRVFEAMVDAGCMDIAWNLSRRNLINDFQVLKSEVDKEKKMKKKHEDYIDSLGGGSIFDIGNENDISL